MTRARKYIYLLLLLAAQICSAQTTSVTGKVTDDRTGEPIPFASIAYIDSRVGTVTDINGVYLIDTYYATDSLVICCVGYELSHIHI